MLYDIIIDIFEGNCNQLIVNADIETAINILNTCFVINDIDIYMTKNTFYNIFSRFDKLCHLMQHLIKTRQIVINRKPNFKVRNYIAD